MTDTNNGADNGNGQSEQHGPPAPAPLQAPKTPKATKPKAEAAPDKGKGKSDLLNSGAPMRVVSNKPKLDGLALMKHGMKISEEGADKTAQGRGYLAYGLATWVDSVAKTGKPIDPKNSGLGTMDKDMLDWARAIRDPKNGKAMATELGNKARKVLGWDTKDKDDREARVPEAERNLQTSRRLHFNNAIRLACAIALLNDKIEQQGGKGFGVVKMSSQIVWDDKAQNYMVPFGILFAPSKGEKEVKIKGKKAGAIGTAIANERVVVRRAPYFPVLWPNEEGVKTAVTYDAIIKAADGWFPPAKSAAGRKAKPSGDAGAMLQGIVALSETDAVPDVLKDASEGQPMYQLCQWVVNHQKALVQSMLERANKGEALDVKPAGAAPKAQPQRNRTKGKRAPRSSKNNTRGESAAA